MLVIVTPCLWHYYFIFPRIHLGRFIFIMKYKIPCTETILYLQAYYFEFLGNKCGFSYILEQNNTSPIYIWDDYKSHVSGIRFWLKYLILLIVIIKTIKVQTYYWTIKLLIKNHKHNSHLFCVYVYFNNCVVIFNAYQ